MAATRTALLTVAPNLDLGVTALIVTAVAAITPLIVFALVKNTPRAFLFKRPAWARSEPTQRQAPQLRQLIPAE